MSANINIENGKAAFMTVKEKAWHGLGQVVETAPTSAQAIKLAGLDYQVGLAPLLTDLNRKIVVTDENGNDKKITPTMFNFDNLGHVQGKFATFREDTKAIFGVVGGRYTIVQNSEAFAFFDAIVGEGQAIYETAGALGSGEKVFITAKLPDYITVAGEDVTEKYLLLVSSHDGSGSIRAMFTPIRVVCNNTLQMALKNNTRQISIRHTMNVANRLDEAHKIMGMVNQQTETLNEALNILALSDRGKINNQQYDNYVDVVFLNNEEKEAIANGVKRELIVSTRKSNIINDVKEYYHTKVVNEFPHCAGTLYGAYNSVTGYFQNVKTYKNDSAKFESNFLGANGDVMQTALDTALRVSRGKLVLN